MSNLKAAAAAFLKARQTYNEADKAANDAWVEMIEAENKYIETLTNSESDGGAVACNGHVVILKEEYWEIGKGSRLSVEKLVEDES